MYPVSGLAIRKLPPIATKTFARPSCIARIAFTVSNPCAAGGWKWNSADEPVKKLGLRLLPDAHRAIALHVAVAAHRTDARTRLADVAAQEQQVDDLLDVGDGVLVLREAHRPASDHAIRVEIDRGSLAHLLAGDAALAHQVVERDRVERGEEALEAFGVIADEGAVEDAAGRACLGVEHFLHDALEQRHVTVDPHLEVEVRDLPCRCRAGRTPPADARSGRAPAPSTD